MKRLMDALRGKAKPKRRHSPRRRLRLESLESRHLLSAVTMTDHEQLLLELVNRARNDPAAEAAAFGISLNDGLDPGTISPTAKQPLAPNQALTNAAGLHSQDMLDNDYFDHTNLQGQSPQDRANAQGYNGGVGENIGWGGSTGSIDEVAHVYERHYRLFLSTGHRLNMLHEPYDELGTGVRYGVYSYQGTGYNSSMVTEKFGISNGYVFITGVAFTDSITDDAFYDIGESAQGLTVTATNAQGTQFQTTTGASGGYSITVPAGTYTVAFSGGGYSGSVPFSDVVVESENVKVDLDLSEATWIPDEPTVSLSTTPVELTENAVGSFAVTISRDGGLQSDLLVSFNVSGTASLASDYSVSGATQFSANAGSVTIPAGFESVELLLSPINDYAVEADETITLQLLDSNDIQLSETSSATLTILNDDSDTVSFQGTPGDDTVTIDLSGDYTFTINGESFTVDRATVRHLQINGLGGADAVTITGDTELSALTLNPTTISASGADYDLTGTGWESITVTDAGLTGITALLYDSNGDDNLFSYPTYATLSDGSYTNRVNSFARVVTFASGGTNDQAYLFDSSGNDTLNALPTYAYLTGTGFYNYAQGFDRVIGIANQGGSSDRAYLYDSAGDDTLNARPDQTYLSGVGFFNYAQGFDEVLTYSLTGSGNDRAYLYDSPGDETLTASPDYAVMRGDSFVNYVEGFDELVADASQGGTDVSRLYDSPNNDRFVATPTNTSFNGTGFSIATSQFDQVTAYATAGDSGGDGDIAYLYDSSGNDTLQARPEYTYLSGNGYYSFTEGFDRIYALATAGNAGGNGDQAYLYDSDGNDVLTTHPSYGVMTGTSQSGTFYYNYAQGFQRLLGYAANGNYDQAYFYDSPEDDTFIATPDLGYLTGSDYFNFGQSFDRYIAISDAGGSSDIAYLYGTSGDDTVNALPTYTYISASGYFGYAGNFDQVRVRGMGGTDLAYLYGSAGVDTFTQTGDMRYLTSSTYYVSLESFRNVLADFSQGGSDLAYLYDTSGDDHFYGRTSRAEFYSATHYTRIDNGSQIDLHGSNGGNNYLDVITDNGDADHILYTLQVFGTWI